METNEGMPRVDTGAIGVSSAARPAEPDTAPAGRSPRRRRVWIVVALMVAIALAVAGFMLFRELGAQRAATRDIDEAARLLEAADAVVIDVDEVIRSEIDAELGSRAAALSEELAPAVANLEEAIALIDGALDDLPGADAPYARALRASAEPRIEMLGLAPGLLDANIKAASALDPALAAWDKVLEAEEKSDEAVKRYNELTTDGVSASTTLTIEAEALIAEARELFSEAETGFPEADFSAYIEFCDGKAELLALSKKADEQWLAGKIADANATIKTYNEKEAVLIEHAKTLPASPVEVVAVAYDALASEDTDAYFDARARATESDALLQGMGGAGDES